MPIATPIQNNFSSGEFRPDLEGRVDIERYASAVRTLRHFLCTTPGGARRRTGTHWVASVKTPAQRVRLIEFEFSDTQAYVLEFGNLYIRFFMNMGQILNLGVPYEIASPYATADLPKIKYVQSADVLYLVHPDHAPRKLSRVAHTSWTMTQITFLPQPSVEAIFNPAATLTPAAATGLSVTFTASASVFLAGDVDRHLISGPSRAVIQVVSSGTVVQADILDAWQVVPHPAGQWGMNGSPNAGTLTPSKIEPTGAAVTLTSSIACFRPADVGKFVKLNDGIVKITSYTSTNVVQGEIVKVMSAVTPAAAGTWTLEVPAWSTERGYPAAVTFHEGRLVFGGTYAQPQTVWGSEVGDFEKFALGVDPADAYEFGIAANRVNIIRWLLPSRVLLIGTKGGEFRITGGLDQAITPTNVDAKSETTYGSNFVSPVRVGASVLFCQRSGRKLRELAFSLDLDAYVAPDLTVLSAHLLPRGGTIAEMSFQQDPEPILWVVRADGILLTLTYDRSNNVVGWAQHPMQDAIVESVAVIPHPNGDREQVWLSIQRTINGSVTRYIEYLDDAGGHYGPIATDSTLTYQGAPATVFSGLEHLRGKTVAILGDGAYYGEQTIPTSGAAAVTISPAASIVEVGLPFVPVPRIETLRAEIPTRGGSSQVLKKRVVEWRVRVDQTMGLTINGHIQPARRSVNLLGDPPTLFTGDYDGMRLGWDYEARNAIEAPLPFPAHILGIFGTIHVSE